MKDSQIKIIAEIGGNHEGDFDYAKELVHLVSESGAEIVKFQVYTGESIVNKKVDPDRARHFNKFALSTDQYLELAELAENLGLEFNASIWDIRQIDVFDKYLKFYKIGSGDLTAYPLLKKIAISTKPIILSTGLSTYDEIKSTLDFICEVNPFYQNKGNLTLLQCTSMYPIPDDEANLNVMLELKKRFGYRVGYSDHTVGTKAAEIAVAMGAEVLELHFTDQKENRSFRDHQVSFTKEDIVALKESIENIRILQSNGEKSPTKSELQSGHVKSFRRSLYLKRNIQKGTIVAEADLIALRPCEGIGAEYLNDLVGKEALTNIETFQPLDWDMFN